MEINFHSKLKNVWYASYYIARMREGGIWFDTEMSPRIDLLGIKPEKEGKVTKSKVYPASELGLVVSTVKLDIDFICEEHGIDSGYFDDVFLHGDTVDLTTYRPPACCWQNDSKTLVLCLRNDMQNIMEFSRFLRWFQNDEYDFLITDAGNVIVRLWWD